jgi:ribosomal protein S18 acetylase RimI-like enzyme
MSRKNWSEPESLWNVQRGSPGLSMSQTSHKRFRMQISLRNVLLKPPRLPEGYQWLSWRSLLLERHAQVKWRAFKDDLDGRVFSCLGESSGCLGLMRDIAAQKTFCQAATWMVVYQPELNWPASDCGTIQGILRPGGIGAIQNVGVTPDHRGQGIGRALVIQALRGFIQCGMACSVLEVTAENEAAVRLYQSIGFEVIEVLYRDSKTGETVSEGQVGRAQEVRRRSRT